MTDYSAVPGGGRGNSLGEWDAFASYMAGQTASSLSVS